MSVSVKLRIDKLIRIAAGTDPAIAAGVKDAAEQIAAAARELAPVDTGRLRSSIAVEDGPGPNAATIRASAPYAVYVEYGTRHMAAQPFMTPARRQVDVLAVIGRHMTDLIK